MIPLTAGEFRSRVLHGLIPAVPVPFKADGQMDEAAQERYIAYMAEQPVAGVAVWAHTGRGLHLPREQRLRVLRSWSRGLGEKKVIVAGVGGSPTERADFAAYINSALELAHDALENGAHALLAHPPRLFHHVANNQDLIINYHQKLASTGAPLLLFYLYEAAGGIPYSPQALRRLFDLPGVAGIKLATLDSIVTFQNVATEIARDFPAMLLITGEDRFFGYSLMCGAQTALVGMGAACMGLQHRMMQAYYSGHARKFLELSRKVDRFSQVTFIPPMEGYIRRMLWALAHLGVLPRESAYDPWGPELPPGEFEEIGKTLRSLGEI